MRFGEQKAGCGGAAQDPNPEDPDSMLGAAQEGVLAFGREAPMGFIYFRRARSSQSHFRSPAVRGFLHVTPGAVSMTFDRLKMKHSGAFFKQAGVWRQLEVS